MEGKIARRSIAVTHACAFAESVRDRLVLEDALLHVTDRTPRRVLRAMHLIQLARQANGLMVYGARCTQATVAALVPLEQR